jgi:acyl-ACP thioesterase
VRDDADVDDSPAQPGDELVACPEVGREFSRDRAVRLGDVSASGRLRLDALARYLQDVAADDGAELGLSGAGAWVLRRSVLRFDGLPSFHDLTRLTTWCSGFGPRWAERRSTVRVGDRVAAESAAVWVFVDGAGRPTELEPWFHELYGPSTAGRRVSGRLRLPGPSDDSAARPWPLRATDLDVLGHVNNAIAWAAVEDEVTRHVDEDQLDRRLRGATLEYRAPIDPGERPELVSEVGSDGIAAWLRCGGAVRVAARVELSNDGAQ